MLHQELEISLNRQLTNEYYSSYFYLSIAAYLDSKGMKGMGAWARIRAEEELFHAMKFFDYLTQRMGTVRLAPIAAPPHEWKNFSEVFTAIYNHECQVTRWIHELSVLATKTQDPAAGIFLQWFVNEQVEEEANTKDAADKIAMVDGNPMGLFMMDKDLAALATTMAAALAAAKAGGKG